VSLPDAPRRGKTTGHQKTKTAALNQHNMKIKLKNNMIFWPRQTL
jgi:hypothetical protein